MSIFASAMQSGMSTLSSLTGNSAASQEAFNAAYNVHAGRLASASAKNAAEKNISAIAQDKIISNLNIKLQQSQAEAMKSVGAAFAGVEGGSVEDGMYVVQSSAENLVAANNQQADQETEEQLARVNQSAATLASSRDTKIGTANAIIGGLSNFELSDLKMAKDIKKAGGISKLWSD